MLDSEQTKIAINSQLKRISNELKKLNIKVNIDKTVYDTLSKLNSNIEKATKSLHSQQDAIQGVTRATDKETQAINNQNKALERRVTLYDATNEKRRTTETYGIKGSHNKEIVDTKFLDGGEQRTTKYIEELKKDENQTQKLINSKIELRKQLAETRKEGRVSATELEKINTVVKSSRNLNELEQLKRKLRDVRREAKLAEDQEFKIKGINVKADDLIRRFGSDKEVLAQLNDFKKSFNENIYTAHNFGRAIKEADIRLKEISASANTARSNAISLGEAFKTAMIKFPIWMAASTAFFGTIRSLQKAVDVIIEVDKQMTVLRRVMNQETNFDKMLKGSIELANELGRSIIQVNEAMTGFARQGYSEDQVLALTKTATLMTNISELSGEEAMSSLTAAMTIFNIEASRSIEIIDALNEVDEISLPTQQCVA